MDDLESLLALREAAAEVRAFGDEFGPDALEALLLGYTEDELAALLATWEIRARPSQLRPEGCTKFFAMAGRGWGKTRCGAEDTLNIQEEWGPNYCGLLISKSYQRDIEGTMLFGDSGIATCAKMRGYEITYQKSANMIWYPHGGWSKLISADGAEALRGPEFNHAWCDEIAKWNNPYYVWRILKGAMRVKKQNATPRYTITSTPKRKSPICHHLIHKEKGIAITGGSTRENIENLDEAAVEDMEADMLGSAFGRQELDGIYLEETGTMTEQDHIDARRIVELPKLRRRVVAFDPAADGEDEEHDDHGIVAAAIDFQQPYATGYVLADRTVVNGDVEEAAMACVQAALDFEAHAIVVETNQGGNWVVSSLKVAMQKLAAKLSEERGRPISIWIPIEPVWASSSKEARAEPVGALYGANRIRHAGFFPDLEKELTTWIVGMPSPNRMDAHVHAFSHLLLDKEHVSLTPYA